LSWAAGSSTSVEGFVWPDADTDRRARPPPSRRARPTRTSTSLLLLRGTFRSFSPDPLPRAPVDSPSRVLRRSLPGRRRPVAVPLVLRRVRRPRRRKAAASSDLSTTCLANAVVIEGFGIVLGSPPSGERGGRRPALNAARSPPLIPGVGIVELVPLTGASCAAPIRLAAGPRCADVRVAMEVVRNAGSPVASAFSMPNGWHAIRAAARPS